MPSYGSRVAKFSNDFIFFFLFSLFWSKDHGTTHKVAHPHQSLHLMIALDLNVRQALHVHAVRLRLADLEIVGPVAARDEQVPHMLVVDLKVRDVHVVRRVWRRLVLDPIEERLTRTRDQARLLGRAHHRVALAGARLPVREDARVVAVEVVVEELLGEGAVDVFLMGVVRVALVVRPERLVEGEGLLFDDLARVRAGVGRVGVGGDEEGGLLGGWVHADEALGAAFAFCVLLALAIA